VIERCCFLLSELTTFASAHKTEASAERAKARQVAQAGPVAELERAQILASTGPASRAVKSVQVRKKDLYEEAVALFEANQKKRMTAAQRDKLWNEAEQTAMAQLQQDQAPAVVPAQGPAGANARRPRSTRTKKVLVGDAWIELV
jgi:hypothetical protein